MHVDRNNGFCAEFPGVGGGFHDNAITFERESIALVRGIKIGFEN